MPYIPEIDKKPTIERCATTAGELNFLITLALIQEFNGIWGGNYDAIHNIYRSCKRFEMGHNSGDNYKSDSLLTALHRLAESQPRFSREDFFIALELAKTEFYRRVVVPYEDKKKDENGDVFNI